MRSNTCIAASAAVLGLLFLSACGGGGGSSNIRIVGSEQSPLDPNSVLFSDMIVSGRGFAGERVTGISCTPDGSRCQATHRGETYVFDDDDDDDDSEETAFTTLGAWNHMRAAAAHVSSEGLQGRFALAGGVTHPNSLLSGSATWNGEMVALDSNNRLVRGDASLTIADFNNPSVDVRLAPNARPVMTWANIPVRSGGFSRRTSSTHYIKGEFYGPRAEEAGGVFERNQLIGAFGARR